MFPIAVFLLIILGDISNAQIYSQNVSFDACQDTPCESNKNLVIDCLEVPVDYSGYIKSPGFPDKIEDESLFGIVYSLFGVVSTMS